MRVIRLVRVMPKEFSAQVVAKQIIRSGTSVGANYRAACIAKSRADFINKVKICAEECDETAFWIELIVESEMMPASKLAPLKQEANELTCIFLKSIQTAKSNK